MLPSFAGFLTANLLLGVADAWESGAKDSYFLKQCLLQKLDYQELKVRTAKYTYAVNFFLALVSTALFQASIYLPLLLTALFYIAATALLLAMPDDAAQPEQNKLPKNFFFTSKLVLKQILRRRALVLEMLFCTTCTSILISNFDFFSMIFESAGISVSMIGAIYASFGAVYGGFAAVTLCATCIYLRRTLVKDKS